MTIYGDIVGSEDRAARRLEIRHALTVAPTVEPVTLEEQRTHSVIDDDLTDDDELIEELIVTARLKLEELTGRAFCTQTRTFKLDHFPCGDAAIYLPRPPLISVTSIAYLDTAGVSQTLTVTTDYKVDATSEPARIVPAYGVSWPSTRDEIDAVTIVAQCGYGAAAAVPKTLKLAVKLLAAYWYERRTAAEYLQGASIMEIPMGIKSLVEPYRVRRFG